MTARSLRVPLVAWVILGVVAVHVGAFWLLADKHFLPKVRRVPATPPADFAAQHRTKVVDPASSETVTESDYVVSTQLKR